MINVKLSRLIERYLTKICFINLFVRVWLCVSVCMRVCLYACVCELMFVVECV